MNVQKYIDMFETKARANGETFVCFTDAALKDKTHEKLHKAMYESDLDQDSVYQFTAEALEAMQEIIANKGDLEDVGSQEASAPIYTNELVGWLARGQNYFYVDQIMDDYGLPSPDDAFGSRFCLMATMAYEQAWIQHYQAVLEAVKK